MPLVRRGALRRLRLLLLVPALVLTVFASHLIAGCKKESAVLTRTESQGQEPCVEGLSLDQSRVVAEYGYPDHFFISIDPATEVRVERWIYYTRGKALDFDNGRLFGEEPVEDKSAQYPPTDLKPQDFNPYLTPEEASVLLGKPLFTHEARESLLAENTIVVYERAVLLYRKGRLIGIDTQVHPPSLPTLPSP